MPDKEKSVAKIKHRGRVLYYWIVIILLAHLPKLCSAHKEPKAPVIDVKGQEISKKQGETLELNCDGDTAIIWSHSKLNLLENDRASWTTSWHQTKERRFTSRFVFKNLKLTDSGVLFCRYKEPQYGSYVDSIYLNVSKGGMSTLAKAILGCLIFLFAIIFIGLILFRRCKRRRKLKKLKKSKKESPPKVDNEPAETDHCLGEKIDTEFYKGAVHYIDPKVSISDQADFLPFDASQWEFPRERLQLGAQVGSGAFGMVVKAEAIGLLESERSTTVAVKMVKPNADEGHLRALICELKIMAHLGRHLNVVNLLGACTRNVSKNNELYVLVEYCRHGSLLSYLRRYNRNFVNQIVRDGENEIVDPNITEVVTYVATNGEAGDSANSGGGVSSSNSFISTTSRFSLYDQQDSSMGQSIRITTSDLLCWAFQIARGMEYLASRKVIHGDLATRNVLLTDNNVVKICDFGLAKEMYRDYNYIMSTKGGNFPVKWMAIESIYYGELSTESDCWSFGVVLWELFSLGKIPYPGIKADEALIRRIEQGYRMDKPEYCPSGVHKIMNECWAHDKNSRPTFFELVNRLGFLIEDKERDHYVQLNDEYLSKCPAPRATDLWTPQKPGKSQQEVLEQDSYGYLKPIEVKKAEEDLEQRQPQVTESVKVGASSNNYVPDPTRR